MSDFFKLIWSALVRLFRSRAALEAEILVLRHQLNVLRRKSPKRVAFILRHSRRELLWLGATAHRQLTEAYGWQQAPRYIVRDRDRAYGEVFIRRLRVMGTGTGRSHHDRHGRMDEVRQ